jgi:hypothetical protein
VFSGGYEMKTKAWGTHWGWERSKKVAVFTVDGGVEQKKPAALEELQGVIREDDLS